MERRGSWPRLKNAPRMYIYIFLLVYCGLRSSPFDLWLGWVFELCIKKSKSCTERKEYMIVKLILIDQVSTRNSQDSSDTFSYNWTYFLRPQYNIFRAFFLYMTILFKFPWASAFNSILAIHTWCWPDNKSLSKSLWTLLIYWPGFNDDDGARVGLKEGNVTMQRSPVPKGIT